MARNSQKTLERDRRHSYRDADQGRLGDRSRTPSKDKWCSHSRDRDSWRDRRDSRERKRSHTPDGKREKKGTVNTVCHLQSHLFHPWLLLSHKSMPQWKTVAKPNGLMALFYISLNQLPFPYSFPLILTQETKERCTSMKILRDGLKIAELFRKSAAT